MALLLATKLTNQITRLAEQAGITLECNLTNVYDDGSRKASGCKGEIRNTKTGKRIIILSSESCPDTVRIGPVALSDEPLAEIRVIDASDAAEKIVGLLTPELITHKNLAKSGITNLPSLAHNPLLATYLSDDASTDTTTWNAGRRMLRQTIQAQGFSPDDFTPYPPSNDAKAYEVADALWCDLAKSRVEPHMVAHHLLAYHDVRPSETVPGRLAYYQDDKKRTAGIRTPIKVRKYLQKFFGKFRTPEVLEQIAETLDGLMQSSDEWDVRLFTDADIDGWSAAYYHITSCMRTKYGDYGVGELETFRCYCTSAMTHGEKSSGLSLVVLYQDDKPVARSITYESDSGDKYYVRNYGDDRLVRWLDDNGYKYRNYLPNGTPLWTEAYDDDNNAYLSPYVDGDPDDAKAELTRIGRRYYWVISSGGVVLQNCSGYTSATILACECCGDRISDGDEYDQLDLHGNYVTLCSHCACNHCHTVDDEGDIYVDPSDMDNLICTNSQGYYTQEYLDDHDLVVTGDEDVICLAEAEYCPYHDEYYHASDFTDLSDKLGFVRDTWAGYINDSDCVHDWLLRRDGTYIDELDCYVHDDHVSAVMARLESEADAE